MQNRRNITVSFNVCEISNALYYCRTVKMTFNEQRDKLMCCGSELGICSYSAAAMKAPVRQGTHFGTVQQNPVQFQL